MLRNGKPVFARGTLRCECLGHYELVAAIGEDSHSREGRFTKHQITDHLISCGVTRHLH